MTTSTKALDLTAATIITAGGHVAWNDDHSMLRATGLCHGARPSRTQGARRLPLLITPADGLAHVACDHGCGAPELASALAGTWPEIGRLLTDARADALALLAAETLGGGDQ